MKISEFWMRSAKVNVGGKSLEYPTYTMEFDLPFDTDDQPNQGEVAIYNLSSDTISSISKGSGITISAGYRGDTGTVFIGTVEKIITEWQQVDKILKLQLGDASPEWRSKIINKAYGPGTPASAIVADMLGILGLEVGSMNLPEDKVYINGRTISTKVEIGLRELCNDCGAKFHIANNIVYISPYPQGIATGFVLSADTGLLESPQKQEQEEGQDGYLVRSLLNHRIHADSYVTIQSRTANGWFRVVNGKHIGGSDWVTEMEVVPA